jgi:putative transposase
MVAHLIPSAKRGGRKRQVDMREVFNGVMDVLSTGCQGRYIPKDLPAKSTLYRYFCEWGYDGTLDRIHHVLYLKCREKLEREASPTACIGDSQSVKSAENPHGFDAGNPSVNSGDQGQEAAYSRRHAGLAAAWHRYLRQRSGA